MAKKLTPFEQAYANARAEELLKFEFNGQQYNTRRGRYNVYAGNY